MVAPALKLGSFRYFEGCVWWWSRCRGNYGIAQRYFKDAVEKAPRDVTAWIGLAASYDRLRRFDLADQAYVQAIRLGGETVQILNIRTCCAAI